MRTLSLIVGTVLACGLAFANRIEKVVYTDGNLTGVSGRAIAVLDVAPDKGMTLRVGRTDVSVPYSSITKADSAEDSTTIPAPGKKGARTHQLVTVEFNSFQGEPRTMTLDMSKDSASRVMAAIHKHPASDTKVDTNLAAVQTPAPAAAAKPDKKAKPEKQAKADKPKADKADKKDKSDKVAKKSKKDKKKDQQEVAANDKSAKPAAKKDDWWGDSYWRTTRNNPKWDQQQGSTAAAQ
jgi:hypothetical protein